MRKGITLCSLTKVSPTFSAMDEQTRRTIAASSAGVAIFLREQKRVMAAGASGTERSVESSGSSCAAVGAPPRAIRSTSSGL